MERTKYSHYEYVILEEDIPVWDHNGPNGNTMKGYSYIIFYWHEYYNEEAEIDSHEWYSTAMEAEDAVQDHIDRLEDGEM
jgi:hypothetical protein